jgi:hypothetical protein
MTRDQFNNMPHHANMFVMYEEQKYYVISVDFKEQLFGLVEEKAAIPKDEWFWVRCESITLIHPEEKTIN